MSEVAIEEPWELEVFIADRLDDWLGLFEGTELVGGGSDEDCVPILVEVANEWRLPISAVFRTR
jgi:hypothetical protein